jgi:hypothetical protein
MAQTTCTVSKSVVLNTPFWSVVEHDPLAVLHIFARFGLAIGLEQGNTPGDRHLMAEGRQQEPIRYSDLEKEIFDRLEIVCLEYGYA